MGPTARWFSALDGFAGCDRQVGRFAIFVVEEQRTLRRERDDQRRRRMRAVSCEELFEEDAAGKIVIALAVAAEVGVGDRVVHRQPIGRAISDLEPAAGSEDGLLVDLLGVLR